MSGFSGFTKNFSFGNTQQPTTTTAGQTNTFGSAPAFGMPTNQPQTGMPTFGATATATQQQQPQQQQSTGGFGTSSGFGIQPASQTPSTGLFNLGGTAVPTQQAPQQQQQTNTSGFAFNFAGNQAAAAAPAKPATTQQSSTGFSGLFSSNTPAFTSTAPTNQLTTTTTGEAAPAVASSFNFNLGSTNTNLQPTPAPTFPLTSTAPAQQATPSLLSNTLGATTNQSQPTSLTSTTQTIQTTTLGAANKTAAGTSGGFLDSVFTRTQPNQQQQPLALTTAATTASQATTTTLAAPTSTTGQSQQTVQTPQQPQKPTQMTFKQLEGYINVWLNELNQMEGDFQKQSQTINSWDSLLVNNALKITNLNENLDLLKEEHKRIDQQLDFVISQQNELEQLLEPLEKIQVDFNVNDTASTEREFTYSLVDTVSNDLQGIGTELQNFIKKLNETKANQDLNDPLSSIGKILNSHIDALEYIEHQISVLKRNVEA